MKRLLLLFFVCISCIAHAQPCTVPDSFFPDDTIVVCNGTSFTLNAPVIPASIYTWSNSDGGYSATLNVNGKYWLQITDAVCSKADTVTVLFNSFLLSPLVADLKICKGSTAPALPVAGQNILWYSDALGGTGNQILPTPSTVDTGSVTYWVTQTIRSCESPRVPMLVKVIDKPKFELGEPYIIPCGAPGIVLQVVPDGESNYTWSNGSSEPAMLAPQRGKYSLYAQNMCGEFRDTVMAVECEDRCVQFANAFTPNGDGKNELYQPACFCPVPKFRLVIYNRNGEKVFQTTDPTAGWNGFYQGKQQPSGAFIYYTEFFDFVLKTTLTEKGTFVLLR
jgi:gliding motility-associated-like protein